MSHQQSLSQSSLSHEELILELKGLVTGFWLTDLSNTSALIMQYFPRINWVGFYLLAGEGADAKLKLGPFQGLPACTEIRLGQGVCGKAAAEKKSIIVDDVDLFPGHIACDARSRSELVVPLNLDGELVGVLDVDSAELKRFNQKDLKLFEEIATLLAPSLQNLNIKGRF